MASGFRKSIIAPVILLCSATLIRAQGQGMYGGGDVFSSNSNSPYSGGLQKQPNASPCPFSLRATQMAETASQADHEARMQDLQTERQKQLANAWRGANPDMRSNLEQYFAKAIADETSRWAALEKGYKCYEAWYARGCPPPGPNCGPAPSTGEFPTNPTSGTSTTPIGGKGWGVSTRNINLQCGGGQVFAGAIIDRTSSGVTFVQIICRSGSTNQLGMTAGQPNAANATTERLICPNGYAVSGIIGTTRDFGRNLQDFRLECAVYSGGPLEGNLGTFGLLGGQPYQIAGVGQLDNRNQFGQTAQLAPNRVQPPRTWTSPNSMGGRSIPLGTSSDDQHRSTGIDSYPMSRCLGLSATGLTAGIGQTQIGGAQIIQSISVLCGGESQNTTAGGIPYQ